MCSQSAKVFPSAELLKINLDAGPKICFADVAFDFAVHAVMLAVV